VLLGYIYGVQAQIIVTRKGDASTTVIIPDIQDSQFYSGRLIHRRDAIVPYWIRQRGYTAVNNPIVNRDTSDLLSASPDIFEMLVELESMKKVTKHNVILLSRSDEDESESYFMRTVNIMCGFQQGTEDTPSKTVVRTGFVPILPLPHYIAE